MVCCAQLGRVEDSLQSLYYHECRERRRQAMVRVERRNEKEKKSPLSSGISPEAGW